MTQRPYRGKHIETGEWIYGSRIGDDVIVGEIVDWNEEYFCTEFWYKVDTSTVGQYTGLQDDNGVKLFEGMNVKFTNLSLGRFSDNMQWASGVIAYDETAGGYHIAQGEDAWRLHGALVLVDEHELLEATKP